jgi:hypothetical protein
MINDPILHSILVSSLPSPPYSKKLCKKNDDGGSFWILCGGGMEWSDDANPPGCKKLAEPAVVVSTVPPGVSGSFWGTLYNGMLDPDRAHPYAS